MKLITGSCANSGCSNHSRKSLVVQKMNGINNCKDCDPGSWNRAAELQKEAWLRGE